MSVTLEQRLRSDGQRRAGRVATIEFRTALSNRLTHAPGPFGGLPLTLLHHG